MLITVDVLYKLLIILYKLFQLFNLERNKLRNNKLYFKR